ncbi:hypothetical protein [Kaistella palustris]|uniref:hypothetical protein n=1 Tax=Kaistella palustris TaxID=493376 RepID=UPI002935111B|nr:hypothetical protein [Kaistella palustris]
MSAAPCCCTNTFAPIIDVKIFRYYRRPTEKLPFCLFNFVLPSTIQMKPRMTRLCIYPKDIQRITGKSERYSRSLLQSIKKTLQKPDHQVVTVEEFALYMGIPYEAVQQFITD